MASDPKATLVSFKQFKDNNLSNSSPSDSQTLLLESCSDDQSTSSTALSEHAHSTESRPFDVSRLRFMDEDDDDAPNSNSVTDTQQSADSSVSVDMSTLDNNNSSTTNCETLVLQQQQSQLQQQVSTPPLQTVNFSRHTSYESHMTRQLSVHQQQSTTSPPHFLQKPSMGCSDMSLQTLCAAKCQKVAKWFGLVVVVLIFCVLLGWVVYQSQVINGLSQDNFQLQQLNSCLAGINPEVSKFRCPAQWSPPPSCRVACRSTC